MHMYWWFLWVLCLSIMLFCKAVDDILSSPGLKRMNSGDDVNLIWSLSDNLERTYTIYAGETVNSENKMVFYSLLSTPPGCDVDDPKANCIFEPSNLKQIGMRLNNLTQSYAGNYTCSWDIGLGLLPIDNNEAALYIYIQPSPAIIEPHDPAIAENSDTSLQCESSPKSLPAKYRPDPPLSFTWYRNYTDISSSPPGRHIINGSQLTITGVQREDAFSIYGCQSEEAGGLQSDVSSSVNIDVKYIPGEATTLTPTINRFQGSAVTLVCSVSDPGNPHWNKFTWIKDEITDPTTTTENKTIAELTVDNHDGAWTCAAQNEIGTGIAALIDVTVFVHPTILNPPSGPELPLAEDETSFDILCSIRGRPAPSVTWTYQGSGLPTGVESVPEDDIPAGKLTTVNRRLRWKASSTLQQRRLTGGQYNCTGSVFTETTNMELTVDVQYGPFNVDISPNENYTALENETVTITCEAECSPSCHYTWTSGALTIQTGGELHFDSIQKSDGGWYICTASNGRGQDKQHQAYISVHYPPTRPTGFRAVRVTAVSITAEWMTGFDGGLPQTFTITYTNRDSGDGREMSDIPDECPPEGCIMQRKITEGIADDAQYKLQIRADNGKGQAMGDTITVYTPERASLPQSAKISLGDTDADITFSVIGQLTDVTIHHCVEDTDNCEDDQFPILNLQQNNQGRGRRQARDTMYNFSQTVDLVDPSASSFAFTVLLYDGDDKIYDTEAIVIDRKGPNIGAIVGGVIGGLLLAALVVVLIVLWRKGIIIQKEKEVHDQSGQDERHYENMGLAPVYNEIPSDMVEISTYEDLNERKTINELDGYATMPKPSVHMIEGSYSTFMEVISESTVCRVAMAYTEVTHQSSLPKILVSKLIKDSDQYPIHQKYLEGAVDTMLKLVNCDNVINCLGFASASTELLLEYVDFGSLRQYLTKVHDATYINSSRDHSRDLVHFIHQAANGAAAVAELEPEALFYCLSLDHVLLGVNFTIKLTGFSLAPCVKAREEAEDEIGLPRPLRWLAPEAIDLKHCSQSDVWSFGILMWEIMNQGEIPFREIPDLSMKSHIKKGCHLEKSEACTNDMYDLMQECWKMKPENRPQMSEVKAQLLQNTVYQNI